MKDLKLWATIVTVTILAWAISTTVTDMTNGFITAGYVFGGFLSLLGIFKLETYMKNVFVLTDPERWTLEAKREADNS